MHESSLDAYLSRRRLERAAASEPDFEKIVSELKQQQRESRTPRVIRQPAEPELTRTDAREILPDFLRLHAGIGRPDKACPESVEAWRDGWSLADIRERSGYSTSDFAAAMGDTMTMLMYGKFENLNAANQSLCRNIDVRNFHPYELPAVSMAAPVEVAEDSELPGITLTVSASSQDGQIKTYGGRMSFSKALWSSHGETIAAAIQNYAMVFSALEAQRIAATLEAASLTTVSGTGVSATNLTLAVEALLQQTNAAGQRSNLQPFGLLVPGNQYVNALVVRAACAWPNLVIVPNAYLVDNNFYLFANPAVSAPLVRLRLRQGGVPRVYANFREVESGPKFAVEHTIGFSVVNVCGVVKCAP